MSSRLPRDEALEKEDRIDEMKKKTKTKTKKKKKKQPTCHALAASTAGPCPTICQSSRTPRHWKLPSTIARPNIDTILLFYWKYDRITIYYCIRYPLGAQQMSVHRKSCLIPILHVHVIIIETVYWIQHCNNLT